MKSKTDWIDRAKLLITAFAAVCVMSLFCADPRATARHLKTHKTVSEVPDLLFSAPGLTRIAGQLNVVGSVTNSTGRTIRNFTFIYGLESDSGDCVATAFSKQLTMSAGEVLQFEVPFFNRVPEGTKAQVRLMAVTVNGQRTRFW